MSTLDGKALFASGPHEIVPGSWQRQQIRRSIPGRDGEQVIDLGGRGRAIRQTGRLQAGDAAALQGLIHDIAGFQDGCVHTLVDNHGLEYASVILQSFELTTPIAVGRCAWADYKIEYLQLP